MKRYFIYILTNKKKTAFYAGITNDLIRRVFEHKNKLIKGFTHKYNIDILVYFEVTESVESAILREKEIKGKSRDYKKVLIEKYNLDYIDLYSGLI